MITGFSTQPLSFPHPQLQVKKDWRFSSIYDLNSDLKSESNMNSKHDVNIIAGKSDLKFRG
jgi:hypothetical protein